MVYLAYMKILKNTKIIIAFDGPDNVGKSTQIALLRESLATIPFVLMNLDRPVGTSDKEKIHYGIAASQNALRANSSLLEQGIPQIIDRTHYTEYAYSILRGGHSKSDIQKLEKEYIHLKDSFFTIIFIDTIENIQSRDDGLSLYNVDDSNEITNIQDRFKDIAKDSLFDNVVINIHGKDIPHVQKEVQQHILNKFPQLINKIQET